MYELDEAVKVNGAVLLGIVAGLFAMLPEAGGAMILRSVRLAVLAILRPAESGARRLIAALASRIVVVPKVVTPMTGIVPASGGARKRVPVFSLFDARLSVGPPVRRGSGSAAGITVIGVDRRVAVVKPRKPLPNDLEDGTALRRRLEAVHRALDDLPGQALRLARVLASGRSKWRQVMRPGRPPGHVAKGRRAVDVVLADCHTFALWALHDPLPP